MILLAMPISFVEGTEKPYDSWLRAGGWRGMMTPTNKWLVLDPTAVAFLSVVTKMHGATITNDEQLMQEVGGGVKTGDINADEEGEGVVFVDQKWRRKSSECNEESGPGTWISLMLVKVNNLNLYVEVGYVPRPTGPNELFYLELP